MNIRRFIIMLFVVFIPIRVNAQQKDTTKFEPYTYLWLEGQVAMERSEVRMNKPVISQGVSTLTFGHQASPLVGVVATVAHAYTKDAEGWSEATIGWSLATSGGLAVSAGPAIEQVGKEYHGRARLNMFYDHESSASFLYGQLDVGQGQSWYWVDGALFIHKVVGIGFLVQMPDLGIGPKLELRMGNHFSVWGAGVRQPDTKLEYGVFGIRLKMGN